jgi:hypothetical protein
MISAADARRYWKVTDQVHGLQPVGFQGVIPTWGLAAAQSLFLGTQGRVFLDATCVSLLPRPAADVRRAAARGGGIRRRFCGGDDRIVVFTGGLASRRLGNTMAGGGRFRYYFARRVTA